MPHVTCRVLAVKWPVYVIKEENGFMVLFRCFRGRDLKQKVAIRSEALARPPLYSRPPAGTFCRGLYV